VSFDPSIPFGSQTGGSTTLLPVETVVTNPAFNQAQSDPGDIGVLILQSPVTGITPATLPECGLLDQLAEQNGLKDALFNAAGYGVEGSGLELNLVSNPVGAFLPATQVQAEAKFRRDLLRKWGVTFHNLYTFGNVPLGRFRQWLADSGNYDRYLRTLADGFNPCTVEGLMCRTQLSVSWDGYLYECDFNLATDRYLEGRKVHVSEIRRMPPPGIPIAVGDYCYACTAGSGFT
jgi:hypothetical protein